MELLPVQVQVLEEILTTILPILMARVLLAEEGSLAVAEVAHPLPTQIEMEEVEVLELEVRHILPRLLEVDMAPSLEGDQTETLALPVLVPAISQLLKGQEGTQRAPYQLLNPQLSKAEVQTKVLNLQSTVMGNRTPSLLLAS